jgi:hypothetical protein
MSFDQIYEGYKGILTKTKIFIPLLYEKGRQEGRSVEEIRSKIAELGVEYKTMMTYTPDWAKHKQIHGPRTKRVNKTLTQNQTCRDPNQVRLVVPEEPKIPPPREVIQELEPQPTVLSHAEIIEKVRQRQDEIDVQRERQPPKPINEPIPIPNKGGFTHTLDTGEFRSDLRIALINGAKVYLKFNNLNEVIEMKE